MASKKQQITVPKTYEEAYLQARQANERRYQQIMAILDDVVAQYQPGGGFGQGALALYEQGKQQALASGMQNLVNAGLANTTIAAGMPIQYEQQVGMPFRLQLEDMRRQRLAEAMTQKAAAIERREDVYPDPAMLAQLKSKASTAAVPSFSAGRNYSGFLTDISSPTPTMWTSPQTEKYSFNVSKPPAAPKPQQQSPYPKTMPQIAKSEPYRPATGPSLTQYADIYLSGLSPAGFIKEQPTERQLLQYFNPSAASMGSLIPDYLRL